MARSTTRYAHARRRSSGPPFGEDFPRVRDPLLGEAGGYFQIVAVDGRRFAGLARRSALPVDERTIQVAAGEREAFLTDATVSGTHVRIAVVPFGGRAALQIARPLTEVDDVLDRLRWILLAVAIGGSGSGRAARPRRRTVGPRTDPPPNRGRRGHHSDAGSTSPGGDGPPGRARAPRRRLQHDAGGTRGLGGGATPARLRCVARAANAADEPAHQRRATWQDRCAAGRRAPPIAGRRRHRAGRALATDRGRGRPRSRRRARTDRGRSPARPARCGRRRACAPPGSGDHVRYNARP